MEGYKPLDEKELIGKMDRAALAERIEYSAIWELIKEYGKKEVDRIENSFIFTVGSDNQAAVEEVRAQMKFWKHDLPRIVSFFKQEGLSAVVESQEKQKNNE